MSCRAVGLNANVGCVQCGACGSYEAEYHPEDFYDDLHDVDDYDAQEEIADDMDAILLDLKRKEHEKCR